MNFFSALVHPPKKFNSNLGIARWWSKVHDAHGEQRAWGHGTENRAMVAYWCEVAVAARGMRSPGRREAGGSRGGASHGGTWPWQRVTGGHRGVARREAAWDFGGGSGHDDLHIEGRGRGFHRRGRHGRRWWRRWGASATDGGGGGRHGSRWRRRGEPRPPVGEERGAAAAVGGGEEAPRPPVGEGRRGGRSWRGRAPPPSMVVGSGSGEGWTRSRARG